MASSSPREKPLPPGWTKVLKTIEKALAKSVEETHERELALDDSLLRDLSSEEQVVFWKECLGKWDRRLQELNRCLQEADRKAADSDAVLSAGTEAVQDWLTRAESVRQRLAKAEGTDV